MITFCVVDIDNAYRSINIFPSHVPFQAFSWVGEDGVKTIYQDHCLCFGIKSAPYIFTQVGNFMVKCLDLMCISKVVNYIESCRSSLKCFLKLLHSVGFAYNEAKLLGPDTTVKYLGIIVDSSSMTLTLPEEKLVRLIDIITNFVSKRKASKKDLQRLAGNLSHASMIIKSGRTLGESLTWSNIFQKMSTW